MNTIKLEQIEIVKLFSRSESHFMDFKAKAVAPGKLARTISAFANSEGGELFVGIEEPSSGGPKTWDGFASVEDANAHIQVIEKLFPLGVGARMQFLSADGHAGIIFHIDIQKSRDIISTPSHEVYVRRGAQNLPVSSADALERLRLNKGISSFESQTINVPVELISNSEDTIGFMLEVVPHQEPERWLRKQMLVVEDKPTVAGVVLFAEEPQALIPKRCGIKIYRYRTVESEGTRRVWMACQKRSRAVRTVRYIRP